MCQGLGPKKHDEISEIDRGRTLIVVTVIVVLTVIVVTV